MEPALLKEINHRLRNKRIVHIDRLGRAGFFLGLNDGLAATFVCASPKVAMNGFDRERGQMTTDYRLDRLAIRQRPGTDIHLYEFLDRNGAVQVTAEWESSALPVVQFNLTYGWPYKGGKCTANHVSTVKSAYAAARVARYTSKES